MAAGYQDLFIEQGTTFTTSLTLQDQNGSPYDLTNFTVRSQARKSYISSNAAIVFIPSIVDAVNGIIELSADAATTANVSYGKLVYDVLLTDSISGVVSRVLEGQIFISPTVTR